MEQMLIHGAGSSSGGVGGNVSVDTGTRCASGGAGNPPGNSSGIGTGGFGTGGLLVVFSNEISGNRGSIL